MQGTPKMCKISNVIVGGQQYKQIQIPSYILQTSHAQDIYTRTFINCGVDINCINYDFAWRNKIPLKRLEKPLLVNNVDGSPNETGMIKHSVILFIRMGGIIHKEEFYTIKCRKDNIILGLPWLNHVNPTINWVNKHINIHKATDQTEEYNLATSDKPFTIRKAAQEPPTHPELLPWEHKKEEPIHPNENFVNYIRGVQYVYTKGINRFQMTNGKLQPLVVAKTSITSKLAQRIEETQVTLPEEYAEFAEVFLEEASQKMPPSRPYDHPILLNKTFVPKIGKVYPLSPNEQKATDNFIEENLRTDPLPHHRHHPPSILERKTLVFDLAKTTDTSMNTPSRTHTHYLLSPTSLTWSKTPPFSQNSTSDLDTTISESKRETNGKLPLLHQRDYLNWPLCFPDYPTPPQRSKDSWMTHSRTW